MLFHIISFSPKCTETTNYAMVFLSASFETRPTASKNPKLYLLNFQKQLLKRTADKAATQIREFSVCDLLFSVVSLSNVLQDHGPKVSLTS